MYVYNKFARNIPLVGVQIVCCSMHTPLSDLLKLCSESRGEPVDEAVFNTQIHVHVYLFT